MTEAPFDFSCLTRRGVPIQHFDAGEKIFLEDDSGGCMYVVQSGKVDVITFGSVLETVGPGGMFGEMALIDDGPRSAAALANEATEAAAIDKAMFVQLVREEPEFALHVMRLLTERIRRIAQSR
ncbi:MAG: Crp/Fnr family transcriptional regulator [Hyphomicrobium sp.]|jgi:CRP-like cAMP-binding protein